MKNMLKTSVIIPSFNEAHYLPLCLEALARQSLPVYEVIVVDNNSSDESISAAKRNFPTVRFLREKKQGIVFARNTGFNAAKGDVFVKLDADTLVDEDWHEHMMAAFDDQSVSGWSGYVYSTELNPVFAPLAIRVFNAVTFRAVRLISGVTFLFGSNMAIRKSVWAAIRSDVTMRNDFWEDLDISILAKRSGANITIDRTPRVSISSRSANVKPLRFYKRLYGQSRVYRVHGMRTAFLASLVLNQFSMLMYVMLYPFSRIGQTLKVRPRLEQY